MRWEKVGLVCAPDGTLPWQRSHAALPTKLHLEGSDYRIYFTSRDVDNRTFVGFFDVDLNDPSRLRNRASSPLLSPGRWGMFDDHGVQACSIARADSGDLYLYYLGWNPCSTRPIFYTSIGLAISTDGGETFERYSEAPIMQRSRFDPWMVSGGTVIRTHESWLMFYLSGFRFEFIDGNAVSYYDVKIARSLDGIDWIRRGDVALGLASTETNISRMTIVESGGRYQAWFPVKSRGAGYRCGYAESANGEHWARMEGLGLDVSESGWDSKSIDKMEVIAHRGAYYMFYNGNDFGRDGIGLAIGHE